MDGGRPGTHSRSVEIYIELVRQIFRLNEQLTARGDAIAEHASLTAARWQVLSAVSERPMSVAQIGRELEITRQSVQRTVNRLVAMGFVRLLDNPQHRRAKLIEPTAAGVNARIRLRPIQVAWAEQVAEGLSETELEQALAATLKIRQRLHACSPPDFEDILRSEG